MADLSDYFLQRDVSSHAYSITNPGAETGDMTGWTAGIGSGFVAYGGAYASHTGSWHFWGNNQAQASSYQDIEAVAGNITTDLIDSGRVILRTMYWGMSFGRYDMSKINLTFYDGFPGSQITDSVNLLEEYTPKRTQPNWIPTPWFYFMLPGTRTIRITMFGFLVNGSFIDSHIDDIQMDAYVLRGIQ